jgi:hypothetical protein
MIFMRSRAPEAWEPKISLRCQISLRSLPGFVIDGNHLLDFAAFVGNACSELVVLICLDILVASA